MISPEGYEVFENKIKEMLGQNKLTQEKADLLFEEISEMDERMKEVIDKLSSVRIRSRKIEPRRINAIRIRNARDILKNNERIRKALSLKMEELRSN